MVQQAVTDQADGLRRLMAASPRRRVAVVSCEGRGVAGFTRNLAAALVQEGREVLLLDERNGPVSNAPKSEGRLVLIHAELDADGALSPLAAEADHILVVLQADAASIKASYACIKRLHRAHALRHLRVLVDGVGDAAEAQRILANLAEAGRRYLSLALEPGGWVRADPCLARSQRLNATVVDAFRSSPAAMDYQQVAADLLGWPQASAQVHAHPHVPLPLLAANVVSRVPCLTAL